MSTTTRRWNRISISETIDVEVDIDIKNYIGDVPTETLCAEIDRRRKAGEAIPEAGFNIHDTLEEIERAFGTRDGMHFSVLMCRLRAMTGTPA